METTWRGRGEVESIPNYLGILNGLGAKGNVMPTPSILLLRSGDMCRESIKHEKDSDTR